MRTIPPTNAKGTLRLRLARRTVLRRSRETPLEARLRPSACVVRWHVLCCLIGRTRAIEPVLFHREKRTMTREPIGQPRILIVDDTPQSRSILERLLAGYAISVASDGVEALALLKSEPAPNLILMDVLMPRMDGFEACRRLKADASLRDIPVILITGLDQVAHETTGLALGAVDYITKPFNPAIVRARVKTHLSLKAATGHLAEQNLVLTNQVAARTARLEGALRQLNEWSLETIIRLSRAAEYKDEGTGAHVLRMSHFSAAIARQLGFPDHRVAALLRAAPLHDIGKIGIPDHILLKQGRLDAAEWQVMKQHTWFGAKILTGSKSEVIKLGELVALTHHEKWDGSGYPQGLRGEEIAMAGRIVAVADVFDTLASKRPYKEPYPLDMCFSMICRGSNNSFDPTVVEAFLAVEDEIVEIRTTHQEQHESALQRLATTQSVRRAARLAARECQDLGRGQEAVVTH
jgi:putative two-component system response regulator